MNLDFTGYVHLDRMLKDIINRDGEPLGLSVANAADKDVLEAVMWAKEKGLIRPYLSGNKGNIIACAQEMNWSLDGCTVLDTGDNLDGSLDTAVNLAMGGETEILMKGMVHSVPFLKSVLKSGLRQEGILSHVAVFDIPRYERLLFITDGGINPQPDLNAKKEIVRNGANLARVILGRTPLVAALATVETVEESMSATVDAALLSKMADRGQLGDVIIDGPLGFDNAISSEAARHKGIDSQVAGKADILLASNIEVGNLVSKSITYFGQGVMAGVVMGSKVPIILGSRADTPQAKAASIITAVYYALSKK